MGIAHAGGCEAISKYHRRYPALVNAADQTRFAVEAAALTVGREHCRGQRRADRRRGGLRLHAGEEAGRLHHDRQRRHGEGGCHNVHSPLYDFSDDILTIGAAYWVNLVQVELGDAAA